MENERPQSCRYCRWLSSGRRKVLPPWRYWQIFINPDQRRPGSCLIILRRHSDQANEEELRQLRPPDRTAWGVVKNLNQAIQRMLSDTTGYELPERIMDGHLAFNYRPHNAGKACQPVAEADSPESLAELIGKYIA